MVLDNQIKHDLHAYCKDDTWVIQENVINIEVEDESTSPAEYVYIDEMKALFWKPF